VRLMPELTKVIGGVPADTGHGSFGQQMGDEWRDVWKAVGVEATAFDLVSLRLGYFEDVNSERGGLMYGDEHYIYRHLSITDIFTERNAGRLRRIGLCWDSASATRTTFGSTYPATRLSTTSRQRTGRSRWSRVTLRADSRTQTRPCALEE